MGPTTITEVARIAKVAVSTVSRVINDHPDVGAETKEKVLEVIRRLGYRPHSGARKLVRNTSETICFILSNRDFINPFHSRILFGVEKYASSVGHSVIFLRFDYPSRVPPGDLVLPRIVWERGAVDGLILAGTNYPNFVRAVKALGMPFVLFGNNLVGRLRMHDLDSVWFDHRGGAVQATEHLIRLGHKKIWFVGELSLPWGRACQQGYARVMRDSGLETRALDKRKSESVFEFGSRCGAEIVADPDPPSAVVAGDDNIALGILSGLHYGGRRVPDDISVVGFDYIEQLDYMPLPLTTVRVPKEQVGEELARMLFERLSNPNSNPMRCVLPTELVVRKSTTSPSGSPNGDGQPSSEPGPA